MVLNSIIYFDLYFSLKYPFYERGKRQKYYFLVIIIYHFAFIGISILTSDHYQLKWEFFMFICCLYAFTLIPIILVAVRINNPGTSRDLRKYMCRRHIVSAFILLLTMINASRSLFFWMLADNYDDALFEVSVIPLHSLGILLAIMHITEPHVWQKLKSQMCKSKQGKKVKFSEKSLDTFLNSAMNVEYVYIILNGISDMFEAQDGNKRVVKYNSREKVKIDNVSINNSHLWDVTLLDAHNAINFSDNLSSFVGDSRSMSVDFSLGSKSSEYSSKNS